MIQPLRSGRVAALHSSPAPTTASVDPTVAIAIRSCERKAEWFAFCMHHRQITSAHFVLAALSSRTNATRLGLIHLNASGAFKQLQAFVTAHALRVEQNRLPVMTRGLDLLLRQLNDGQSLVSVLADQARYGYIVTMLRANGLRLDRSHEAEAA